MSYAADPEEYRAGLEAKLEPVRIRSTLAFAGLYQLTYELLKRAVLDEVKNFYGYVDFEDETWMFPGGEAEYHCRVAVRANRASLLWLAAAAITVADADRLDDIYRHRHDLTHELAKYLVEPDFEPNVDLLLDGLRILKVISRFWV